ncbi:MAG: M1 family aminopeptidase [Candidatus Baltobacteraceae bacterium]
MIADDVHRPFALPGSRLRYGPDKTVDVVHIHLDLEPDLQNACMQGICTTTVCALDEPVSGLLLDAIDLDVSAVTRSGAPMPFRAEERKLRVLFDPPLQAGEQTSFAISYTVRHPRHGLFFIAPTPDYPDRMRHVWSQSQDENARYWFPCVDYPHEKQTTSARISVPHGLFALSNGALEERREQDGRTIFHYRQDVPHSTYLTTLVVGPFTETAQGNGIFYYVLPGREADGERAFGKTPAMMRVFQERTGMPYPYARYSQIAVSDFIFGGMENTSATTQTDRTLHDARAHLDFSSDPLVSHELAHQWFGDLLTCRDWAQAWLNEGFATFFEAVYREADLGYDEYLYDVFGCVERYLNEDSGRYRRPIVYNKFRDPIELFDRHLYEKGGAVLHMLRGELGEARFWRALRRYVADNAGRSVETIDFVRAIEAATGRNMRAFFDQWVFRGGHPELKVTFAYDAERKTAKVTIDQNQAVDDEHPPYAFEAALQIDAQIVRVPVERAHETVTIPLAEKPALFVFDPGAFVLGDVRYALGTPFAIAVLESGADVVAKIRAARELIQDAGACARAALAGLFEPRTFWGIAAEAAPAIAATRAPWARNLLLRHVTHPHPKVRRAVVAALGTFRDEETAAALLAPAQDDASYFVQAAALHALGKTRDERAFAIVSQAVEQKSWNGVLEAGAAAGLAELADSRALPLLVRACRAGGDEALRRAAITGLARHAQLVDADRTSAVHTIVEHVSDPMFMVARAAIRALEELGDARALPALQRVVRNAFDGRIRRDAAEAALRVREAQKTPAQVTGLRTDLDALREEQRQLQEKIEALSRA